MNYKVDLAVLWNLTSVNWLYISKWRYCTVKDTNAWRKKIKGGIMLKDKNEPCWVKHITITQKNPTVGVAAN